MYFSKKIFYQYFVVSCPAWDNFCSEEISHSFLVLSLHSTKNLNINHPRLLKPGK